LLIIILCQAQHLQQHCVGDFSITIFPDDTISDTIYMALRNAAELALPELVKKKSERAFLGGTNVA
jgi:hypothetical protein